MKTASYYKQYAKKCLLNGRTQFRAFENCFENEYSDEVVCYLMLEATRKISFDPALPTFYQAWAKEEQARLVDAIKRRGLWDKWLDFLMRNSTPELI